MKTIIVFAMLSMTTFFNSSTNNLPEDTSNEDGYCRLQLVGLKCIMTEGFVSADAIYFDVDFGDEKIEWPSTSRISMTAGDYRDLTNTGSLTLDGDVTFEMWDDDTWDADDHLGTRSISCYDKGAGEKYIQFTEDGAHYRLYYKVY